MSETKKRYPRPPDTQLKNLNIPTSLCHEFDKCREQNTFTAQVIQLMREYVDKRKTTTS